MHTVLEIIQKTTNFFLEKNIENARLNAELLLAHQLKCQRMDLYLQFERPLSPEDLDALRPQVRRRGQREPLQYILGTQSFIDLELKVDPRALIPRPETEELIELILEHTPSPPRRILDLGTGTGAIALALAQAYPQAHITAIDASAEALQLAQENAAAHQLSPQVQFIQSHWFEHIHDHFDLIVSNPPYLTEDEWTQAQPEVKQHEPHQALVAEQAGIADLTTIITQAPSYLHTPGQLYLETGIAQHPSLLQHCQQAGFNEAHSHADLSQRPRFIRAQQTESSAP